MTTRFAGRTAIVTGGASGIGAATVRLMHDEGATVVIADQDEASGQMLAKKLGARALFVGVDVSQWASVSKLVEQACTRFGRLDVLVNNAGIGSFGDTATLAVDAWKRVLAVDLDSVFYGCKAAVPHMRACGHGSIVNVASVDGLAADYGFDAYNAAKAGVINLTRAVAINYAADGVRCNAVCPGPTQTPILRGVDEAPGMKTAWLDAVPAGRFAQPDEIARVIAFLASDDASYMTGSVVPVDGGLTAYLGQPRLQRFLPRQEEGG